MKLLEKTKIGNLELRNRIAMAPMTRSRATAEGVVQDMTATYYTQRSTVGLIITEGINISEQALGSPWTPGIFTDAQIEAWKKVTAAVHAEGGKIFAQLWHTGRVGHSIDKNGNQPVAPSAIAIQGQQHFTSQGPKEYETPKELTTAEVQAVVQDYIQAAKNADKAGFDGVELHGAFGYLPNQFLVDSSNKRNDMYGGSIENRSRFVIEVMEGMVEVLGAERVGIKLSPSIPYNNMIDSDPLALYSYLIGELDRLPLAYIQMMQPLFPIDDFQHWPKDVLKVFKPMTRHTFMVNGGYNKETAEQAIEQGANMVSFGKYLISNPDLPYRFEIGADLNEVDQATMYGGAEKGYIDYPFVTH